MKFFFKCTGFNPPKPDFMCVNKRKQEVPENFVVNKKLRGKFCPPLKSNVETAGKQTNYPALQLNLFMPDRHGNQHKKVKNKSSTVTKVSKSIFLLILCLMTIK